MLTLIGDVHGKISQYLNTVKQCEYSVQLGDFALDPASYELLERNVDPANHKILFGNHDRYPLLYTLPHSLGDFGVYELGGIKFFFIRGSISIDKKIRLMMQGAWYEEEELTFAQAHECIDAYAEAKPDIVLTHDCPVVAKDMLGGSSSILAYYEFPPNFSCFTQKLLQVLWDIHQPTTWHFAHWHRSKTFKLGNTTFTCLNELETLECK